MSLSVVVRPGDWLPAEYSPWSLIVAAGLLYILLRMGNIALSATLLLVVQG